MFDKLFKSLSSDDRNVSSLRFLLGIILEVLKLSNPLPPGVNNPALVEEADKHRSQLMASKPMRSRH